MTLPGRMRISIPARSRSPRVATLVITTATTSLLLGTPEAFAQPRLDRVAERITECVVDRQLEGVRRWVRTLPGSREEYQVAGYANWSFTTCLSAANGEDVWNYRADLQSSRERIAVALLARDFPDLPAALPTAPSGGSWIAKSVANQTGRRPLNREAVQMLIFGDCVARADWTNVSGYVRSAPGSAEEGGFVRALRPHMGGCLPPGLTAAIDRPRMRALVSEAVYHIMVDAQGRAE